MVRFSTRMTSARKASRIRRLLWMQRILLGPPAVNPRLSLIHIFFDLDGKFLFYVVEPTLKKHYDNMPRRDMTKDVYKRQPEHGTVFLQGFLHPLPIGAQPQLTVFP